MTATDRIAARATSEVLASTKLTQLVKAAETAADHAGPSAAVAAHLVLAHLAGWTTGWHLGVLEAVPFALAAVIAVVVYLAQAWRPWRRRRLAGTQRDQRPATDPGTVSQGRARFVAWTR